jgi:MFS superfamily sulfate permease-like transporter
MTCGSLVHDGMVTPTSNPLASVIAGALIFVVFFSFHTVYTFWPVVLLGGAFYLIAAGCSFFGLFTSRSARRLLVMIAALSHIVIERPGIKIGRLLSNAFEKRRTNTPSKPQTRDIAAG